MKMMQAISAVLVLGLSLSALATPTLTIEKGLYQTGSGGEFEAVVKTVGLPGHPVGSTFQTFCVELGEDVRFGGTYYAVVNTKAINGGKAGGSPDPLDPRTAWLYDQFVEGTLPGYFSNPSGRTASAGALQNAIWYIENEITGLPSGLATTFYNLAVASDWDERNYIGKTRVLNLYTDASLTQLNQDVLVSLPAPGAMILVGIGTAVVGAFRRRMM